MILNIFLHSNFKKVWFAYRKLNKYFHKDNVRLTEYHTGGTKHAWNERTSIKWRDTNHVKNMEAWRHAWFVSVVL